MAEGDSTLTANAKSILESFSNDEIKDLFDKSILTSQEIKALPPKPPDVKLSNDDLFPTLPTISVETKMQAYSIQLQHFCAAHPVSLVDGLTNVLDMDLSLFSTRCLLAVNRNFPIKVVNQVKQFNSVDNLHPLFRRNVWSFCEHNISNYTLGYYGEYQVANLLETIEDNGHEDSSSSDEDESMFNPPKMIKFGSSLNLSDDKIWNTQLLELTKLPYFACMITTANFLSHIDQSVVGMNAVELNMKVPGCRLTGRQQPNNFCTVNINTGPGDCEWFVVPSEYWGAVYNMCEKHNVSFIKGSWWPILEELYRENIPVYRFNQKPSDMVYLTPGTIYWVHATGWSNNVSWAVGPLTVDQLSLSIARYEWNLLNKYRSAIPMMHLVWCLARNLKFSDSSIFHVIKKCLLRCLLLSKYAAQLIREKKVSLVYHGRQKFEPINYCVLCEAEIFNYIFVFDYNQDYLMHCMQCAIKKAPNLENVLCVNEYKMNDLMDIYDKFVLFTSAQERTSPRRPPVRLWNGMDDVRHRSAEE